MDSWNMFLLFGICVVVIAAEQVLYHSPQIAMWLFRPRTDEKPIGRLARRIFALALIGATCAVFLWLTFVSEFFSFRAKLILTALFAGGLGVFGFGLWRGRGNIRR